jgi:hypothetical protein
VAIFHALNIADYAFMAGGVAAAVLMIVVSVASPHDAHEPERTVMRRRRRPRA